MGIGDNETLKFNPQEILAIFITEGHIDKSICPSKEIFFVYVKNVDDLQVLMWKLGSVITDESKHESKDS